MPTVRRAVAGYLDRRGCESEASLAVALVITELASNVVLHAYPHTRGVFEVSILPADGWIDIVVADDGVGFSDANGGGLGLRIVRELCDSSTGGHGVDGSTRVTARITA